MFLICFIGIGMASEAEIEGQRGRLVVVLAAVGAMLAGVSGGMLRRAVLLNVLSILRPAESAARRLIAILAHGLVVKPGVARAMPEGGIPSGQGARGRAPVFRLFDPRKYPKPPSGRMSAPGNGPGITEIGVDAHRAYAAPGPVGPDDMVGAAAVFRRVAALRAALDDLPKQARRLARSFAKGRAKWLRVMRPGRPPGHRARGIRPVDEVLADCQWFALEALREKVPP